MTDAVVTNHLKVLVGDMDNEFFNKINNRKGFGNEFVVLMTIVMKSNRIPIVTVDSGCSDYRTPKIASDIFYYG